MLVFKRGVGWVDETYLHAVIHGNKLITLTVVTSYGPDDLGYPISRKEGAYFKNGDVHWEALLKWHENNGMSYMQKLANRAKEPDDILVVVNERDL